MEVNFDNLRRRAISSYNSLVSKLNHKRDSDGYITIDSDYIEQDLESLRSSLATLAFIYQEGENGFESLDEDTHFEIFGED